MTNKIFQLTALPQRRTHCSAPGSTIKWIEMLEPPCCLPVISPRNVTLRYQLSDIN